MNDQKMNNQKTPWYHWIYYWIMGLLPIPILGEIYLYKLSQKLTARSIKLGRMKKDSFMSGISDLLFTYNMRVMIYSLTILSTFLRP